MKTSAITDRINHAQARQKLDEIRNLIIPNYHKPCTPCLTCGADKQHPDLLCRICGEKQVRAENLLRAIVELLNPKGTGLGWGYDRVDPNPDHHGVVEEAALAPVRQTARRGAP